jgi:hypothetical protein
MSDKKDDKEKEEEQVLIEDGTMSEFGFGMDAEVKIKR